MRTIGCSFVLLVISLAEGAPVVGLSRRPGASRRLAEEARLYGDLTRLMAFHADILVGTPGQIQSVIVDTGSGRTAFPCTGCGNGCGEHMDPPFNPQSSSTFRWVQCGEKGCNSCSGSKCSYNVRYVEGSSINGEFFEDVLQLGVAQRANQRGPVWMGCHSQETMQFRTQAPAGIMGLNEGGWDVVKALADGPLEKEIFALCLAENGGSMTLGGTNSTWMPTTVPFQWTPYKTNYVLDLNGINFGGLELFSGFVGSFQLDPEAIREAAKERQVTWVSISCLEATSRRLIRLMGPKSSHRTATEEEMDRFPNATFRFGNANYTWPAKGYMFLKSTNTWCFSFFTAPPFLLGASFMMNNAIIFDREEKKIGFAPSSCPRFVSRNDLAPGIEESKKHMEPLKLPNRLLLARIHDKHIQTWFCCLLRVMCCFIL
ncbi:unnamed protein product [Durusdinium trenchii]|uniref:Peptidase A1 domain-containing protein n=1 Tax=Durusdinium trenchii TaxID=1381693 RepID=A0ABP0PUC4_9DINO